MEITLVVFIIDIEVVCRIEFTPDLAEAKPVHIALYSPTWPPQGAANGIVSYVSTIRDYFTDNGHRVSILSDGKLHMDDDRAVTLLPPMEDLNTFERIKYRLGRRTNNWHGALPWQGRRLAAQVHAARHIAPFDVLEMEESFGWSHTVQRLCDIPVVTRLHGPHFLKPVKPRTGWEQQRDTQRCASEGRAVRSARTLTAPTRAIMEVTCDAYGRQPQDHDAIIPNPIRLASQDKRWSLQACDRNHILMIGRFDYWKGADTMLSAFDHLLESHPLLHLTLVGPDIGIESNTGEVVNFEAYTKANFSPETAARITFTGTLTPPEIATLRQRAFVTILASRVENFPYALLEGLAAGCPMISTDWPGSEEIIRDGVNGFLTPIGDPGVLARRIAALLDNPPIAARAGAAGLSDCAATFSIERVGQRLLQCHEATLRAGA